MEKICQNCEYQFWASGSGAHLRKYCSTQCRKEFNANKVCVFSECDRRAKGGVDGLCASHWRRMKEGRPNDPILPMAPKGSGWISPEGYHRIQIDGKNLFKHRIVMEEMLGRPLEDFENVHHINGDKLDNRPENLELWITHQPKGQRAEDALEWAETIIARYSPNMGSGIDLSSPSKGW